ncbi:MAG: HAD family hydrolase [Novosphingobium sp.]|nr:HAD family hydrolase [Novosphingobium sp.]
MNTARKPLIVTDCDEVLLYMVVPFRDWLASDMDIDLDLGTNNFGRALRRRGCDEPLEQSEIWQLLEGFFDSQMHRQSPITGACESMQVLRERANVVVLTNLGDERREARQRQLDSFGFGLKVYTNQGPKGPALRAILDEYGAQRAFFIDDLAHHHASASEETPHVTRLHLVGEPILAPHIPCAFQQGHAHARIDDWSNALAWLCERLDEVEE